jgi:hypothetical protein
MPPDVWAARKHQLAAIIAQAFVDKDVEEDTVFKVQQILDSEDDVEDAKNSVEELLKGSSNSSFPPQNSKSASEPVGEALKAVHRWEEFDLMTRTGNEPNDAFDYSLEELERIRRKLEGPRKPLAPNTASPSRRPLVESQPLSQCSPKCEDPTLRILPKK